MTIPIIDLRNFAGAAADDHATARAIGEACERVGFFSIVNAGSHKTRSSQHGDGARLFDMPLLWPAPDPWNSGPRWRPIILQ
ncbi:MAG: 2-oxoglutarate and iron-dependent oxygenase domain-containing protein [Methylobacteriaceae bacterium]|nr:2-oxoglutarate and iron-dependent oxygenase domain-containing protein [Methylobacteriaceae bacterium]MBV9636965.1 2-oxoglutarate and iron-dependent oxygenase domain-containing protein [Methylobacteriaceae bacterium]MBV9703935.1 2-oxoglutarate and iron-dependent oxygenase domain-containing protein [Methylobacteriaceae bacterium]